MIDPADIELRTTGSANGPASGPRSSRARQTRNEVMILVHVPTSIEVSGEIPAGNYTRKEMIAERDKLHASLMAELETQVAKRLRQAGR